MTQTFPMNQRPWSILRRLQSKQAVDVELQARVLDLHDRYHAYTTAHLHEHEGRFERHVVEAEAIGSEHPLLADARQALTTAVSMVYRR